jgi:hypothetical protein
LGLEGQGFKPCVATESNSNSKYRVVPLRQAQGQDDNVEQTNATAKANTEILSEAQNDDAKQARAKATTKLVD